MKETKNSLIFIYTAQILTYFQFFYGKMIYFDKKMNNTFSDRSKKIPFFGFDHISITLQNWLYPQCLKSKQKERYKQKACDNVTKLQENIYIHKRQKKLYK